MWVRIASGRRARRRSQRCFKLPAPVRPCDTPGGAHVCQAGGGGGGHEELTGAAACAGELRRRRERAERLESIGSAREEVARQGAARAASSMGAESTAAPVSDPSHSSTRGGGRGRAKGAGPKGQGQRGRAKGVACARRRWWCPTNFRRRRRASRRRAWQAETRAEIRAAVRRALVCCSWAGATRGVRRSKFAAPRCGVSSGIPELGAFPCATHSRARWRPWSGAPEQKRCEDRVVTSAGRGCPRQLLHIGGGGSGPVAAGNGLVPGLHARGCRVHAAVGGRARKRKPPRGPQRRGSCA